MVLSWKYYIILYTIELRTFFRFPMSKDKSVNSEGTTYNPISKTVVGHIMHVYLEFIIT